MWNDIDLYHAFRDFTSDPVTYPMDAVHAFTAELVCGFLCRKSELLH
jgi:alpha-glucosidase